MFPDTDPVRFTRHAKNRMRWRRISEAQVRKCVTEPSLVEPASRGETHSWVRVANRFLRVTWIEEQGTPLTITAVLKRLQPRGWKE